MAIYDDRGYYTFEFSAELFILETFYMVLEIPDTFQVMSVSECTVLDDDENVLRGIYCTTDPLTNTMKIEQFTDETIDPDVDLSFTVDSI